MWDTSFGGVVGYGETYEENAQRELMEESGISVASIEQISTFYYDGITKVWGKVF